MAFLANHLSSYDTWNYILGVDDNSIAIQRFYYLQDLNYDEPLKIAFKDPNDRDGWGKWLAFPGGLVNYVSNFGKTTGGLTAAIDVHRSVLKNEIVVESDYPEYEDNWKATKIIGSILESKGFIPHYYYSGSKSIHIHIFLDWEMLKKIEPMIKEQLKVFFKGSLLRFKNKFIEWLREKMISCWDTGAREFDTNFVRATHLIRAELSKNKKGYKTFLGYSYKDLSFVPIICNEKNGFYPVLGKLKKSNPNKINEIMEEFLFSIIQKTNSKRAKRKNACLSKWLGKPVEGVRECVGALLSDDFKKFNDGYQRAMFIIINELRRVYGAEKAKKIIFDWNERMGFPVKEKEIEYRFTTKEYNLPCPYIHGFLSELGLEHKCRG